MKLRIERDALAEAVAWAARSLPTKPTNPVLSGVLLQAVDERVILSSSDQAVSSQVSFDAEVGEPGDVVVSGRLLADIAKALPARPVSLDLDGTRLVVQCGRARFTMPTLPVAEYPALPAIPPVLGRVVGHTLSDAVAQVAIAASREDALPMLTGIQMEFGEQMITLAATDRYRLAVRELPWQPAGRGSEEPVLIRAKHLVELARPLATVDAVELSLDETRSLIGITGANRRSTTPVLDGDFPDYRKLLPKEASSVALFSKAELIDSVKRVKLVVDRSNIPMQLDLSDGEVLLRAGGGEDAGATDVLECDLQGAAMKIAFNPEYLLEGLAAVPADTVRLAMQEPHKPAVLSAAGDDSDYQYLLMPVRISS
jgi:DNA polymerase-3 subunit beta